MKLKLKEGLQILLLSFFTIAIPAQEICNNGIDDDGDGLIDLNDSDCDCEGFSTTSTIPSLIPNSSFEDNSCCPSSYSQLNCADTWVQATDATSDYFNCGYNFGAATNAGITAADGTGYVGAIFSSGWQEYVGACLLQPMQAGVTYNLQMSVASFPMDGSGNVCGGGAINYDPIDISIFGAPNCSSLPWGTTGCPSGSGGDWSFLTSSNYNPVSSWSSITLTVTPTQDINTIMIGSPCTLPANYSGSCYAYFVFDDLTLAESTSFTAGSITESGDACAGTLQLDAEIDTTGGSWQWYLDGVALVGQTSDILDLSGNGLGTGTYQAVYTVGPRCDMLEYTVATSDLPVADYAVASVCQGEQVSFQDQSTVPAGTITEWEWDFDGDGVIDATGQNPNYTYPSDGTFSPMLVVTSDAGCVDTLMAGTGSLPGFNDGSTVTVSPLPTANFDVDSVCFGNANSYNDLSSISSGSITSWQWDFGDGNLGTAQNEIHSYGASGLYNVELLVTSDNGCQDSLTQIAQVYQLPEPDFTPTSVCEGVASDFTDVSSTSIGLIDTWSWDFTSDGSTDATTQNASNSYLTAGNYDVTLGVTTDLGCFEDTTISVTVHELPTAAFTASQECQNELTQFTDGSTTPTGTITNWSWDFDLDGTEDNTAQNPAQPMGAAGSYTVELTVTNSNGCQDTETGSVIIDPLPQADFTFADVCDGTNMVFTDQSSISTGFITSYSWDFGDASGFGTAQNENHLYANAGQYVVELLVTSDQGCLDSIEQMVEVFDNPSVDFTFNNACVGTPVTFSDNSNVFGAASATYSWDFTSNGSTDFVGLITDHTYLADGSYFVTLDVVTADGCIGQSTQEVVIFPNPIPSFSGQNVCEGNTVSFTNNSTISSGTIQDNVWDFANGNFSNQQSPDELFTNEGVYYVTLAVTSGQGCEASTVVPIDIYPNPVAQFITSDVCDGATVNFTDFSNVSNTNTSNSVVYWEWEFGTTPVTNALGQFASHLYYEPGTYTVTLDIETNHGCSASVQQDVTVHPNPLVSFESPNPSGCTEWCPTIVNTTTIESGSIDAYLWNLGDGMASTAENPSHCYVNSSLQTSNYTVTLTATSEYGCATTLTETDFITVYPLPVAGFGSVPEVGNIYNPTIQFLDSSLIAENYSWTFGDLGGSSVTSPSYTFPDQDSGVYQVCLYVETQYGCEDFICHDIIIEGITNIYVPNSFTPNGDGLNDFFMPSLYGVSEDAYEFYVFDRWGALIYSTNNINGYWDGTYLGEDCMLDTYVWKVNLKDKYTGEIKRFRGHVSLFR